MWLGLLLVEGTNQEAQLKTRDSILNGLMPSRGFFHRPRSVFLGALFSLLGEECIACLAHILLC